MEAAAAYGGNLSDFFIYKCIPGYGDPVLRAHGLVQWMGDGFVCLPGSSARMVCGACVCRLCAETACQEYLFHKAAVFPAVVPCGCFASCGGKWLLSCFYKRNLFKRLPVWQGAGSSFFAQFFRIWDQAGSYLRDAFSRAGFGRLSKRCRSKDGYAAVCLFLRGSI